MRIEVPAEAAGERLDVFLAAHVGSRAAAQRLIDAGRVRVDGEERAKRHALHGGEVVEVRGGARGAGGRGARGHVRGRLGGRAPARGRQARGRGRAPGARAPDGHARPGARAPRRRRRRAGPRRARAPARPRHLRAAGRRALRGGPRRAQGAAQGARDPARVPGAGRGAAGRSHGQDRGAAGARPARAHADLDRHRRRARGGHALRDRARRSRATRCCACGSRPGARTRSART